MDREVDWCKVDELLKAYELVQMFLNPAQRMAKDNYLRAFDEEMNRLGPGHDDEAVLRAKEREPVGFEITIMVDATVDSFSK
jgi:hypothetical protein